MVFYVRIGGLERDFGHAYSAEIGVKYFGDIVYKSIFASLSVYIPAGKGPA
jgi:hypothetical protein